MGASTAKLFHFFPESAGRGVNRKQGAVPSMRENLKSHETDARSTLQTITPSHPSPRTRSGDFQIADPRSREAPKVPRARTSLPPPCQKCVRFQRSGGSAIWKSPLARQRRSPQPIGILHHIHSHPLCAVPKFLSRQWHDPPPELACKRKQDARARAIPHRLPGLRMNTSLLHTQNGPREDRCSSVLDLAGDRPVDALIVKPRGIEPLNLNP